MANFYFIVYSGGDESVLTVIDLSNVASYERDQFSPVNEDNYYELAEAINDAKALAKKYSLRYERFESRYNSELNEKPEPLTL